MNYRRRIMVRQRRQRLAATVKISPAAEAILAEYGYQEIPTGLEGTGSNGNIIKADAVAWVVQHGHATAPGDEEE